MKNANCLFAYIAYGVALIGLADGDALIAVAGITAVIGCMVIEGHNP